MNSLPSRVLVKLAATLDGWLLCQRLLSVQALRSRLYGGLLLGRCGPGLRLKCGVIIDAPARVTAGQGLNIGEFTFIDASGGVSFGNDVIIGHRVSILSSSHGLGDCAVPMAFQPSSFAPVTIRDDVWIGAGACILMGVTLGAGCVVGAGSVVTRSVAPYDIVCGVPARVLRNRKHLPCADEGRLLDRSDANNPEDEKRHFPRPAATSQARSGRTDRCPGRHSAISLEKKDL